VRATLRVDAAGSEAEPLYRLALEDMALDDLRNIAELDVTVPDALWIDDHVGAVLALIEATRGVRPHRGLEVAPTHLVLEALAQGRAPVGIAAPARMPDWACVRADEDVVRESGQA
jgi:hypothetical protein